MLNSLVVPTLIIEDDTYISVDNPRESLKFKRAAQLNCEPGAAESAGSSLSARQAECLRWVAQGKTDPEIGIILDISPRTVRFHLDKAKDKLKVMTRVQAVTKAVKDRLIAA